MKLNSPVEFDEGDVGLAGGIQTRELGSAHPVVVDSILRFGGSCSPEMPWPEVEEDEDRIERVERLIQAAYKQAGKLDEVGSTAYGGSSSADSPLSDEDNRSDTHSESGSG
eukprot:CAMPEP_0175455124 /NCGR_PEP_ID=MMETSP0095-20121207/64854_1 /TAXON_ID=311494 /ORGANISM="Alexandrium monilatum, Strain CCMP3105" /LENGTH=110 /DNA_ID=CAMNT_0016755879 /DNA_START=88 /DNA_END=420 /DNA_ORIENTATION=+